MPSLALDQSGHWVYTLNDNASNVQALASGETVADTFTVQYADFFGGVATQTVTVNVTGTNDAPVITAGGNTGTAQEDVTPVITGQLTATDVDHGATQAWSVANGTGAYGSLTVDQNGQWTYTLNNGASNVQSLAQGQTVQDSFTVQVDDGNGGIATQTVTVNIAGTNDAPIVTSAIPNGTAVEDIAFSVDTSTHFTDIDSGDVLHYAATLANGDPLPIWLHINSTTGLLTGTANHDDAGDLSIKVTATDSHGASTSDTFPLHVEAIATDTPVQQVNTFTLGDQLQPSVTTLNNGEVVITWSSLNQDGGGWGIYGQILAPDGTPIGSEIHVSTTDPGNQLTSSVVKMADGGFLVTWASDGNTSQDSDSFGIFGQRFDAAGDKLGGEFLLNTGTAGIEDQPMVTSLSGGGFVVGWNAPDSDGRGVFAQVFDANSQPVGNQFELNTTTALDQDNVSLAGLQNGGFIAVWQSQQIDLVNGNPFATQDGWGGGIFAQQFDASGNKVGPEFGVNTTTSFDQINPAVTTLSDGSYVVVWQSLFQDIPTDFGASFWGVIGQHFAADGTKIGGEFIANTTTANQQILPAIIAEPDGGYIVTWTSYGQDNASGGVFGQRFDANGDKVGGEVQLDESGSFAQYDQTDSAVTHLANDGFAVAYDSFLQDGSGYGIFLRFFGPGVTQQNHAPVAVADTGATVQGTPVVIDVLANDTDQDAGTTLTVASASVPNGHGTVTIVGNQVSFDPGHDFDYLGVGQTAQVVVSYTVSDEHGAQSTSTATITVTGTNDLPVAVADTGATVQGTPVVLDVLANDTDADANHVLTLTGVSVGPNLGTVTVVGNQLSFDPGHDFDHLAQGQTQDVVVTYTVTDDQGATSTSTATITVTGTNDAPVVTSEIGNQTESTPFSLDVSTHFADADTGDVLHYAATLANGDPLPSWITIDPNTGIISGTAGHGDLNGVAVLVTATDILGASVSDTFDLTVHDGATPAQQVNTTTANDQLQPSITTLTSGEVVITWSSLDQDGGGWGIYGRIVDANGTPTGPEIHISTTASGNQLSSSVVHMADGGFVVTWASDGNTSQDSDGFGIIGQRFDATGAKVGGEFGVNTQTAGTEDQPTVTSLAGGGFVVAWNGPNTDGLGVFAQVFDANSHPVGNQFEVNTTTAGDQSTVALSGLQDGGFIAVWQSSPNDGNPFDGQDGWSGGIYAQQFDADGNKVGTEFGVNTTTSFDQINPAVTTLTDGSYVVTWQSLFQDNPSDFGSSFWGVIGQHFAADGTKIGGEFIANTTTANQQILPAIASEPDGGFIVTWTSYGQDDASAGVFGQRFDANGNKVGGELQLDDSGAFAQYDQTDSAVTGLAGGGYAVTYDSFLQDGSGEGIYVRFFGAGAVPQNHAPVANTDTGSTDQDHSVTINVLANDTDQDAGATLTVASATVPNGQGSVSIVGNQVVFNPGSDFAHLGVGQSQQVVVSYTIHDDHGATATSTATITVTGTNDAPVVSSEIGTQTEATPFSLDVSSHFSDVDVGDHLSYSATLAGGDALPEWITIDPNSGVITGTGGTGHGGHFSVEVTATDGSGASVSDTFALTVHAMTDATVLSQVTAGDQSEPMVTALTNGNYVVTWGSYDGATALYDIDARMFAADGTPIGDQFLVNSVTDNSQFLPSVGALTDGGYVVTWTSELDIGNDFTFSVQGQRYDAEGHALGGQFQVNSDTSDINYASSVTGLSNGGYVVTWVADSDVDGSYGVFSQIYDVAGNAVGGEFEINNFTNADQDVPKVSALANGGFVAVWESGVGTGLFDPNSQDGWGSGIYAQVYDASGHPVSASDIAVNTTWYYDQENPAVTTLADGSFVVAWQSLFQDMPGQNPAGFWGVIGQHFAADGSKIGDEFVINTTVENQQINPSISALANGGFVVSWTSYGQDNADGSAGVYGQQFDASGHMIGTEFQINTLTNGDQLESSTAGLSDGSFVTAYTDATNDGSGSGVYAHNFSIGNSPFTTGNDTVDFNNLSASSYEIGTQYAGLGGNDTVTLPFTVGAETASGFDVSHVFTGGSGNDTINSGALGVTVNGGAGNDSINFGFLNNVQDTVVVNHGNGQDTITNFETAHDVVDVSDFHFASFSDVSALITEVGVNAVISFATGEVITLVNTDKNDLHSSNFLV